MPGKFDHLLPGFVRFSAERWQAWLTNLLSGREFSPWASIELERASIELTRLLDDLEKYSNDQAELFLIGAVAALEHTRPSDANAHTLLTLIELVGAATPLGGKRVLMNLLRRGELKYLKAANTKLEVQALAAVSNYSPDDSMLEFIQDTARQSTDLNLLGVCLRTAIQSGLRAQACRIFFPRMLHQCRVERDYLRVADEVKSLAQLHCHYDFHRWLMKDFLLGPWEQKEYIPFLTALDKQVVPFLRGGAGKLAESIMLKTVTEAFLGESTPEMIATAFRHLAGVEDLDFSVAAEFAIMLFADLRHARPEESWTIDEEPDLSMVFGPSTAQDLAYLSRGRDIDEERAELRRRDDGLTLNLLTIGIASDLEWQMELKERFLESRAPRNAMSIV